MSERTPKKFRGHANRRSKSPAPRSQAALQAAEAVHILSVLSKSEQRELLACEAVIERGWYTFLQVGTALQRIRDAHLYRYRYKTFADYCRDKWKIGHTHAYRLIGAAQVMAVLSPIGDIPTPRNESQVRPLLGLDATLARAAWIKAVEFAGARGVTAKDVRRAVGELTGNPARHKGPSVKSEPLFEQILSLLGDAEQALDQSKPPAEIRNRLSQAKSLLLRIQGGRGQSPE